MVREPVGHLRDRLRSGGVGAADDGIRTRGILAERTGLEPATSGVTGRHSNRLNYRSGMMVGAEGFEPPTFAL